MKKLILTAIVSVILTLNTFGNDDKKIKNNSKEIGRYQLVPATLTTPIDNNQNTELKKVIFKIDTVTGEVWKYDIMYAIAGKESVFMINGWDSKIKSWGASYADYAKVRDRVEAMEK